MICIRQGSTSHTCLHRPPLHSTAQASHLSSFRSRPALSNRHHSSLLPQTCSPAGCKRGQLQQRHAIGIPKVPFRLPGEPTAQWIDVYNRLYRERVLFMCSVSILAIPNACVLHSMHLILCIPAWYLHHAKMIHIIYDKVIKGISAKSNISSSHPADVEAASSTLCMSMQNASDLPRDPTPSRVRASLLKGPAIT